METIFWVSLASLLLPYAIYPAIVNVAACLRPRRTRKAAVTPRVSIVITTHNEAHSIAAKLANTRELDYPSGLVEIILADDGSTDGTIEHARATDTPGLVVVEAPERKGKTAAQNLAVEHASGEILLFTDATAMVTPDSLTRMIAHFADPDVGCVTGNIRFNVAGGAAIEKGLSARRGFEITLRIRQSFVWTNYGATGALYALRRDDYVPIPADLVSDFCEPLQQVMKGKRTIYEPNAWCYMDRPVQSKGEFARRRRVTVRGLRGLWYSRRLLNPFRYPWSAFSLFSHRLIRWFGPFFMIGLLVSSLLLFDRPVFRVAALLQLAFYGAAFLGWISSRTGIKIPLVHVPYFFTLVNVAALSGILMMLKGERFVVWEKAPAEKAAGAKRA